MRWKSKPGDFHAGCIHAVGWSFLRTILSTVFCSRLSSNNLFDEHFVTSFFGTNLQFPRMERISTRHLNAECSYWTVRGFFFVQRRGISVVSFLIRWIETLQYGDVLGFLLFFLSFSPPAYILVKLSNDFAFIITATVFWYNYYFPLRWAQSKAPGNARTLNRALRSSIGKSLKRPWWYTAFLIRIFCERRVMDDLRAFCDCVIFFLCNVRNGCCQHCLYQSVPNSYYLVDSWLIWTGVDHTPELLSIDPTK